MSEAFLLQYKACGKDNGRGRQMGIYVNPMNNSMMGAVNSEIYVDKTGLLKILNRAIGTEKRCFAVSRARRFGKSMAAGMIDAFFSRGCDSRKLFSPFEIAKDPGFDRYLNKFNVLHFDVSTFFNSAGTPEEIVPLMDSRLLSEMTEEFPYLKEMKPGNTSEAIGMVYKKEKCRFIVIIDEYDCIVRDDPDNGTLIKQYLKYLRGFFKTEESKHFLALGYITGILPIKKVDGESALNNFSEFTMTDPDMLSTYFGFTQREVLDLCDKYDMDPDSMNEWYDGYFMYEHTDQDPVGTIEEGLDGSIQIIDGDTMILKHMYNPNSVVEAIIRHRYMSYWKNTGSFASLRNLISMNYSGLKDDVIRMLTGEKCRVDISGFQNDMIQFKAKDDVLTCLIHMGYLGYDVLRKEAFIPNREVAEVYEAAVKTGDWDDVGEALRRSEDLLRATWDMDEKRVAEAISSSHQDYASIISFFDENALATAIMVSYYTARSRYYVKREMPAGRGFADIAFIPKHEGSCPAMIIELKWNRNAKAAIKQIKDKNYAGLFADYKGEILLVAINYSKKSGRYSCKIEKRENDWTL